MNREQAFTEIIEVLKPYVKNNAALNSVSESTTILEDLQINSARLVDIILAVEDKFDIAVDDEAADKMHTLGDAVDLVLGKTS